LARLYRNTSVFLRRTRADVFNWILTFKPEFCLVTYIDDRAISDNFLKTSHSVFFLY
jgi:hypothetical protein